MSKRKRDVREGEEEEEDFHGYTYIPDGSPSYSPTSPSYYPTSPSYEPPLSPKVNKRGREGGEIEVREGGDEEVVEKGLEEEERILFPLCTDRLLHELNGEIIQKQENLDVLRMKMGVSESILDQTKARRVFWIRQRRVVMRY